MRAMKPTAETGSSCGNAVATGRPTVPSQADLDALRLAYNMYELELVHSGAQRRRPMAKPGLDL